MKCKLCEDQFKPRTHLSYYCDKCSDLMWGDWEKEHASELKEIDRIIAGGHSRHCACRQVWGDGECECDLYKRGYDPYRWMKYKCGS